jgi:uncharacterized membrane-anchored protein
MKTATRHPLTKVPDVTIYFWIVKILSTGMGESTSDYLVHVLNPALAVMLGGIGFAGALSLQFWVRRYMPGVYWFTVVMVAVFGTMAADVLHIGLGIPYLISTLFFAVALIIIFTLWYLVEKTLSIHSIYTPRREMFYWATVMATFALGTAAGDMTAITLKLGYFSSGVLFAILIAIVTITHYAVGAFLTAKHRHLSRNAVLAFWLAYILTRPLGASFADWMGKAQSLGGLGWGDGLVTLGLTILIVGFVVFLTFTHKDVEKHAV